MLASILPQPASLGISLSNNMIFLHPPSDPDYPTNDPLLNGRLVLHLSKPRSIRSFTVTLVARYDAFRKSTGWESGTLYSKDVHIDNDPDQTFAKGDYVFEFSIVVPAWFPSYERCSWGRVYHKLIATARGAGVLGSDVTVERPVNIVINPAAEGETFGLNASIEGFIEELGPYALSLTSSHLTVSGLMHTTFMLASPPQPINIISLTGDVVQTLSLHSQKHPKSEPESHVRKRRIFHFDHTSSAEELDKAGLPNSTVNLSNNNAPQSIINEEENSDDQVTNTITSQRKSRSTSIPSMKPSARRSVSQPRTQLEPALAHVEQLENFNMAYLTRLPDDDTIRPTTQPGTRTPLKFSHEIVVTVLYQSTNPPRPVRELVVRRNVVISSCCCLLESLVLPSYTPFVEDPSMRVDNLNDVPQPKKSNTVACLCGTTYEQLIDASDSAQDYAFMQSIITAETENRRIREALESAKGHNLSCPSPSRPSTPN